MEQRIFKNHLYFHLQDYIEFWDPPAGWDSLHWEIHHKSEIKAPSKSTQCNKSTCIHQTANRQLKYWLTDRTMADYSITPALSEKESNVSPGPCLPLRLPTRNGDSTPVWQEASMLIMCWLLFASMCYLFWQITAGSLVSPSKTSKMNRAITNSALIPATKQTLDKEMLFGTTGVIVNLQKTINLYWYLAKFCVSS